MRILLKRTCWALKNLNAQIENTVRVIRWLESGIYPTITKAEKQRRIAYLTELNGEREYERNGERYEFLRWGQEAFDNFRVVPPGTGICHQVNLEYLAQAVWISENGGKTFAYPDTLYGTDSHTTMVNGLGVLGWGVGGIEAEAAMLNQPLPMLPPDVIGGRFTTALREGVTAPDLVPPGLQLHR